MKSVQSLFMKMFYDVKVIMSFLSIAEVLNSWKFIVIKRIINQILMSLFVFISINLQIIWIYFSECLFYQNLWILIDSIVSLIQVFHNIIFT